MSLSIEQARLLIEPLRGRTIAFLVNDRQTNLSLMKGMTAAATTAARGCTVLDIDAFFSSNSYEILACLPPAAAKSVCIHVPDTFANTESEFSKVFKTDSEVIMVQSLNTLYHLFQSSGVGSRTRKVAFAMICLAYFAKASGKVVMVIMYGRDKVMKIGGGGSISDFADATVLVEDSRHGLSLKCGRGMLWPEGEFHLRLL